MNLSFEMQQMAEELVLLEEENQELKNTIDLLKAEIVTLTLETSDIGNNKRFNEVMDENAELKEVLRPMINFLGGTFLLHTKNVDLSVAVLRAKELLSRGSR